MRWQRLIGLPLVMLVELVGSQEFEEYCQFKELYPVAQEARARHVLQRAAKQRRPNVWFQNTGPDVGEAIMTLTKQQANK